MLRLFRFLKGTLSPPRFALTPAASRRAMGGYARLPVILCALLVLSACGGSSVKDSLGLTRTAPDEFTVVSRPALTVPPDFNLRPPREGEPPRQPTADETARGLLVGKPATAFPDANTLTQPTVATAVTPVITTNAPTTGESSFLKRAGADQTKEDIRDQLRVDETTPADTSTAKSLLEQVNGDKKSEPVVDAKKEAERLRENKDTGKPANDGTVPDAPADKPTALDKLKDLF